MTCGSTSGPTGGRFAALSETQVIEWLTGWVPCVGMDTIRPTLKLRAASSDNFEAQIVCQVAKVRADEPEDPVLVTTAQSPSSGTLDYCPGNVSVSSDAADAVLIRFGIAYAYATSTSQCMADVELEVTYHQYGQIAGASSHELSSGTSEGRYVIMTPMLPAILVDKVKAAVSCTSLTGNFKWRLAYRTATAAKDSPGAWSVVTDGNAPYGSGDTNTGDLSVTLGSVAWVQLGLQYYSTTGEGQAALAAAVGTRRT